MSIKIATPCSARWEDMSGDERSRFCRHCTKEVYNFSRMTQDEISRLIEEKKGGVCARIYQRADGTMLLENCPVGLQKRWRRVTAAVCAAMTFVVLGVTAARRQSGLRDSNGNHPVLRKIDVGIETVKGWFGLQRPTVVMGEICPVITPTNTATQPMQTD